MYSDKQFADEICRIVDPKDVHTGAQIIRLVEEKFTSTNTGSPKLPHCGIFVDIADDLGVQEEVAVRLYNWFVRQLRAGA